MKTPSLLFLLTLLAYSAFSQTNIPDTINAEPVTELQTVQTPLNTLITALMVNNASYWSKTVIYRSTDNGATWDSVFSYGSGGGFNATPDPVLTVDDAGIVYMTAMRHLPLGGGFTAHLWMWRSTDDGLTWSLASTPYTGNAFADYPSLTSAENGLVYLSYTHYDPDTSYVRFTSSTDAGSTWANVSTFGTLPNSGWNAVGSDLGWGHNGKLFLSYGDYNYNVVYYTSSNDSGATWAPVQNTPVASGAMFLITKIVSSNNYSHLGIIAHRPHAVTDIYYVTSLDEGNSWQYQTISNNSAYCEGVIDAAGTVHLVYNESLGTPRLCYKYSGDEGQTFSSTLTLLPWTSVSLTAGEYQSLLIGNDGLLHVTYVDWNEAGTAKHLVFAPMVTDIYLTDPSTHAPRIFPNPAHDVLSFRSDETIAGGRYDLIDISGKTITGGTVTLPLTTVDISSLDAGTYLLHVSTGNVTWVQKVVKN